MCVSRDAGITATNKQHSSAEGKSAILSPYFHYHHLILHKHVEGWGGVVVVHPQMGSRKEEEKYILSI